MNKITTQHAIDVTARLLYEGGWPLAIAIIVFALIVLTLVRVVRAIFKAPIFALIIGYIIYKK